MKYTYKTSILLTACVNPDGMSCTELQDSAIRKQQYIDALTFYLERTDLPVVFCENTDCDFSGLFDEYVKNGRLEYICFNGNGYDKRRGKGYGEALILIHAIETSRIIKHSKYVIKITGRVVVSNIMKIAKSPVLSFNGVFRSDLVENGFLRTVVFISTPAIIGRVLKARVNDIMEDSPESLFENVIYQEIVKDRNIRFIPFFYTTNIKGVFATKNVPYTNKLSKTTLRDNLFFWRELEYERKSNVLAWVIKMIYYMTYMVNVQ